MSIMARGLQRVSSLVHLRYGGIQCNIVSQSGVFYCTMAELMLGEEVCCGLELWLGRLGT